MANGSMGSGYAEVELPFGYDPPDVYCPACGKPIFSEQECDGCEHLVFAHMDVDDEFSYVSPKYEAAISKIAEDEEVDDKVEAALKLLNKSSILTLRITFGGMACGPICFTSTAAIDFAPNADGDGQKSKPSE